MSAANIKNVRGFAGWAYFRPSGEAHFRNLGHLESLTRNIETTREDYWAGGTGVRRKEDVETTESSATISFVLRETSARNWCLANLSAENAYTQIAATAEIRTASNVERGTMIDVNFLNLTNVVVTDGTTDLEAGIDYELDALAGTIEFHAEQANVDITFDAPEILATDGRLVANLLEKPEGITGELLVKQNQKRGGKRFKFEKALINVMPDGDLTVVQEDTGRVTLALSGDIIANPNSLDAPFGRFVEIDA
jgi:hypothetical protein